MQFNNSTPAGAKALKQFSAFFIYGLHPSLHLDHKTPDYARLIQKIF